MGCPYGHDRREQPQAPAPVTLDSHAAMLRNEGIGPESRMCYESVLESELTNPRLSEIHAEEGVKFTALARRVAPPELAAQFLREASTPYSKMVPLEPARIIENFRGVMLMAELDVPRPPELTLAGYHVPTVDTERYFKFCSRDPNLYLACFSFSVSLQIFVAALNDRVARPDLRNSIDAFGRQFDAKNLTVVLPVIVCRSLCKLRGEAATAADIDKDVMFDALTALHTDGVFTSTEEGRGPAAKGLRGNLECPMEGYLFELLVKHQALQPIIAGISRAHHDLKFTEAFTTRTIPQLRDAAAYAQNFIKVRELAVQAMMVFELYRSGGTFPIYPA
jgi:hypothetical protein